MKKFLILFLLLCTTVEAAPPTRVATYSTGEVISSDEVTSNEDAIFNYLQAGVDSYSDLSIVNADVSASANIQSDKLNLTSIAQGVSITSSGSLTNAGSTSLTGGLTVSSTAATFSSATSFTSTFSATGTSNTIGNGGSDALTLNLPGGMSSAAMTWTLSGSLTVSGTIANLGTVTTADINGGTMDGVQVGGTTATGELIVNNSSDDADGLGSQGTSGQVLTSAGAGANPVFATPDLVLVSATTITAAQASTAITIEPSKRYLVLIEVFVENADGDVILQFNADTAGNYDYRLDRRYFDATADTSTKSEAGTEILLADNVGLGMAVKIQFYLDTTKRNSDSAFINGVSLWRTDSSESDSYVMGEVAGVYDADATIASFIISNTVNDLTGAVYLYEFTNS